MFGFGRRSTMTTLTPGEVCQLVESGGVTLVDVREPSEWAAGHIAGAVHMPLGTLRARLGELPADKRIVFYCQAGGRSAQAVSTATAAGYPFDTHMGGGFGSWKAHGLPVKA